MKRPLRLPSLLIPGLLVALQGCANAATASVATAAHSGDRSGDVQLARNDGSAVNGQHALNADGDITIENIAGSIVVTGWDKNQVSYTGELGDGILGVDMNGDDTHLDLKVRYAGKIWNSGGADLHLKVPAGAHVHVTSTSADITASGLQAPVELKSVSGDLHAAGIRGGLDAATTSGDISIDAAVGDVDAHSVSGDLRLTAPQGKVSLRSVSGELEITGGTLTGLQAQTVSGDLRLHDTALGKSAIVSAQSTSGDVHLKLAAGAGYTAHLKSFSGDIIARCASGNGQESGDRKSRTWVCGDGSASLDITSFSGDVTVESH
jgi:DUF4097 and DUF4098 domain-containing protein YvlB